MASSPIPQTPAPRVFGNTLRRFTPAAMPAPVSDALGKLLRVETLDRLYGSLRLESGSSADFARRALETLGAEPVLSREDAARVPTQGPALLTANHPFGLIEGMVLAALLPRIRPDVKILANSLLGGFEEIRDLLILVNPFGGPEAARANARGMREALDWLGAGHLLAVFPAGEVSSFQPRRGEIADPAWSPTVARLIRKSGAAAVPAYFSGANSLLFQIAGLVHPRLRTALLPHELLNKRKQRIELRVGHAIAPRRLATFTTNEELTAHLRERSYWLGERGRKREFRLWRPKQQKAIAGPMSHDWIAAEITGLPRENTLLETPEFLVCESAGHRIPAVLMELGRERERAFRAAGEGTGQPRDLDRFDHWYRHIVLWHKEKRAIAGAYRICGTDAAEGGLYTETLFRFKPEFFRRIGTALELGRSFVAPEFQRSFQPLLLLWKGIGAYLVKNARYRFLFGPVSISNEYQPASRDLMAAYLRCAAIDPELAPLVAARRPFQSTPHRHLLAARDIEEIESAVADLEPDAKGIPVLVRQYLRLGGRIAALHVDKGFGDTLDGLVVMDLLRAERRALERYLGAEGLAHFLAAHGHESAPR